VGLGGRGRRYSGLAYPALRGANQLLNASGVLAALKRCGSAAVTAQAVRNGLAMVELPGRFQIVPGQPTLVLDVAHNPHAVAALAEPTSTRWVSIPPPMPCSARWPTRTSRRCWPSIGPLVDRWYFTDLPTPRAAKAADLLAAGRRRTRGAMPAGQHPCRPMDALRAAVEQADPTDRILVFGSFFTVGGVLAARRAPPGTCCPPNTSRTTHR
jgi:dihydrofolate synthase/folylpolyglutamate synthase